MSRRATICADNKAGRIIRISLFAVIALSIGLWGSMPFCNAFAEEPSQSDVVQTVSAEDSAAAIDGQFFETLQAAVDQAADGDTIVLTRDISEKVFIVGKSLTIDLDGRTWRAKGGNFKSALEISESCDVSLKNGTMTGARTKPDEKQLIEVYNSDLRVDNMTFKGNEGGVINAVRDRSYDRKNDCILNVTNCLFTENNQSDHGPTYLIQSHGSLNKTYISNTSFVKNNRPKGEIIHGMGDYTKKLSKTEIHLESCDIKDNTVYGSSIIATYNTRIYLNDTTVSGNTATSDWGGATGGIAINDGWLYMTDSACYNNKVEGTSYANDAYISVGGFHDDSVFPLPQDMKDHGEPLTKYRMFDNRYNYEFTEAVKSSSDVNYSEISIEKDQDVWELAAYDGKEYMTVAEAVAAMNGQPGTVRILRDAKLSETIQIHDGVVIDLDGHTLTPKDASKSALDISGGKLTIQNGSFKDGMSRSHPVVEVSTSDTTIKNVAFENNIGVALWARHYKPIEEVDPDPHQISITDCVFKGNATQVENAALTITGHTSKINNCQFENNGRAMRLVENFDTVDPVVYEVENTSITGSTALAVEIFLDEKHKAFFRNCEITNNQGLGREDSIIYLKEVDNTDSISGGEKTFENCRIAENKDCRYTVYSQAGALFFKDSVIENNEAGQAGAIYVDIASLLGLKDTVIKNNKATDRYSVNSGGIALFGANLISITPGGMFDSKTTSEDLGYKASGLIMEGGALYNNSTNGTSPTAEDLYVAKNCSVKVPEVKDMKDGDYDFSMMEWKDDTKDESEALPDEKDNAVRYYSVGLRTGKKQIYIDGVKGDDAGTGSRKDPVKTIGAAKQLAKKEGCGVILVLDTITIDKDSEDPIIVMKANTLKGADKTAEQKSEAPAADDLKAVTADMEGFTLRRDPDFVDGYMIDVKEGVALTLRNGVIDGNADVSTRAVKSLIKVDQGASLILDAGIRLKKNGISMSGITPKGGAVYCLGDMVMKEGAEIRDNYALNGGGICMEGGTLNMEGGLIDGNTALWSHDDDNKMYYGYSYGGGVALNRGAVMNMTGGVISNNSALTSGGGVAMGTLFSDTVTEGGTVTFNMRGGSIADNKAYSSGGGLFVQCSTVANIYAGNITGNEAQGSLLFRTDHSYFAGGGIYVNGYHNNVEEYMGIGHGKLNLTNVEIADNKAEWEGGAIAVCGSGNGNVSEINGTVIHDNRSYGKGDEYYHANTGQHGWNEGSDIYFDDILFTYDTGTRKWSAEVKETFDHESSVSPNMLNGASYNWIDGKGDPVSDEALQHINGLMRLNTDAGRNDKDVKLSAAKATVHINGNTSMTNGGGIGCNGSIFIGKLEEPEEPEEPPVKEETEEPVEPPTDEVKQVAMTPVVDADAVADVKGEESNPKKTSEDVKDSDSSTGTGDESLIMTSVILMLLAAGVAGGTGTILLRRRREG